MNDKIFIFKPTGEYRKVKLGECFDMNGSMSLWDYEGESIGPHHIYKRYEIKIPEEAVDLYVSLKEFPVILKVGLIATPESFNSKTQSRK